MSIFLNKVKVFCKYSKVLLNLPDLGAGRFGGILKLLTSQEKMINWRGYNIVG